MTKYIDGFVFVVPKNKVDDYKKMAEDGKNSWLKHGALEYFECMGDDLEPKEMEGSKPLGFTELANAGENETVWFSFIIFKSKEHRNEVNAKVMQEMGDKAEEYKDFQMPFDMSRMAYGGFKVEVEG